SGPPGGPRRARIYPLICPPDLRTRPRACLRISADFAEQDRRTFSRKYLRSWVAPDLAALWRDLGLKLQGESLAFDDAAPLAAIRKSITEARDN
ncbi:MAG: hypothetical protein WCF72_16375, partial [Pseudolabrys sp.]